MKIEQIYTKCLAQGAYYIESDGEAAVIDPLREISEYIELAKKSNSKIKYVFETHFHADFVSGHLSLAKKTGASIVYGPNADPDFEAIIARDNDQFKVGKITLTAIHTPGHTLESTTYLLTDEFEKDHCIFTGDTLFLGDVGIPDVAQRYMGVSKEELAGILYESVNNRIKPLSDELMVYPGHGAGSACGKNMMKETVDTLANQKKINYALNGSFSKVAFIKELTDNLPEPPTYFPLNVKLNQQGYVDFETVLEKNLVALDVNDFELLSENNDTIILDVRNQKDFIDGHIPNSLFIGLNGTFAPWVGTLIKDINQKILLITPLGKEKEAITRLSRVGYDNCIGYLKGGFKTWKKNKNKISTLKSVSATSFVDTLKVNKINILDVRKVSEYNNNHIEASRNKPLSNIKNELDDIDKEGDIYVHCAGGYRSVIAISILKQKGFKNLIDVAGGFGAIKKSDLNKSCYNSVVKCSG
jgi:glyoxylase-like metal-dependent hydrolase (beta-lactamase superfamily II)/rhodanese-related sulfurtransferase